MPVYDVEVCRIGYGFRTIRIDSSNEDEAVDKALDSAGNYSYDEKTSNYEIESVEEVEE